MLTSFAHWSIKIFLHLLFSSVVYNASSPSPCVEISGGNFAPLGFNTSFRCSFAIKCGRESSILWLKVVDDKPMFFPHGRKGHIAIGGDEKTEENLYIFNVTESDEGLYKCQIQVNKSATSNKPETHYKTIQLHVLPDTGINLIASPTLGPSDSDFFQINFNSSSHINEISKNDAFTWTQLLAIWIALILLLLLNIAIAIYLLALRTQKDKKEMKNDEESIDIGPDTTGDDLMARIPYLANGSEVQTQVAHNFQGASYSQMADHLIPPPLSTQSINRQQLPMYYNTDQYINTEHFHQLQQVEGINMTGENEEESISTF